MADDSSSNSGSSGNSDSSGKNSDGATESLSAQKNVDGKFEAVGRQNAKSKSQKEDVKGSKTKANVEKSGSKRPRRENPPSADSEAIPTSVSGDSRNSSGDNSDNSESSGSSNGSDDS